MVPQSNRVVLGHVKDFACSKKEKFLNKIKVVQVEQIG